MIDPLPAEVQRHIDELNADPLAWTAEDEAEFAEDMAEELAGIQRRVKAEQVAETLVVAGVLGRRLQWRAA